MALEDPWRLRTQPTWGRAAAGTVLNPDEILMQQILGQSSSVDAARAAAAGDTRRRIIEALNAQPKALGPGPSYIPSSGAVIEAGPIGSTGVAAQAAQAAPAAASRNLPVLYQGPTTVAAAESAAAPAAARASMMGQLFNKGAWTAGERATGRMGWLSYGPNAAAAEGAAVSRFAPGTLGRAGLYGLAGQVAGGALEKVWNDPNSSKDNAAVTALKGAGIGAGIGTLVLPGVGTAVGGALGGIGGAIWGGLRGGHQDKDFAKASTSGLKKLNGLMDQLGLTDDSKDELRRQYQVQSVLAAQSEKPVDAQKAIIGQLMTVLPGIADQEASTKRAAKDALAMQATISQFMQPYIGNLYESADLEQAYYQKAADSASTPALRDALALRGQQSMTNANRLAGAWQSASQSAPLVAIQQQTGASASTLAQLLAQGQ